MFCFFFNLNRLSFCCSCLEFLCPFARLIVIVVICHLIVMNFCYFWGCLMCFSVLMIVHRGFLFKKRQCCDWNSLIFGFNFLIGIFGMFCVSPVLMHAVHNECVLFLEVRFKRFLRFIIISCLICWLVKFSSCFVLLYLKLRTISLFFGGGQCDENWI